MTIFTLYNSERFVFLTCLVKKKSVKQNFLQKKSRIKFINNSFSTIFINEEKNQTKPDHTFLYNSLDHRYLTEIHLLKSTH